MSLDKFKRYKDIIAFRQPDNPSEIIAFHANNLELANISEETFAEMTSTDATTGEIPESQNPIDLEAFDQLENWNEEKSQDTKSGEISFGIRSLTINVTQICNLKCTYCAAGGDGTYGDPITQISIEKTFPQLQYFIDQLKPGRKFHISFVGGEPLLYPDGLFALCHYVKQAQLKKSFTPVFSLITNGTLITEEIVQKLIEYNVHVTVSIDGSSKTNDLMRPAKNKKSSTELSLNGIQKLQAHQNQLASFSLSGVLNESFQNLIETYHFFSSFNPDSIEFSLAYSQDKPQLQQKYISEMTEIANLAWQKGQEKELRKIKTFDHYFNLLDNQQKVENHCGAGKSYLMVDAKNQLYTCPWSVNNPKEMVGKGSELDLASLQKYQKPLILLNNCQTCWARFLCGGGCMYIHQAHTGDKHTKDKLFCERTRSLILVALLYYKLSREG